MDVELHRRKEKEEATRKEIRKQVGEQMKHMETRQTEEYSVKPSQVSTRKKWTTHFVKEERESSVVDE